MNEFHFYRDKKYTIWERAKITIDAETKDAAIEILKSSYNEDTIDEIAYEWEKLDDTIEDFSLDENLGFATEEFYDDETNEILFTNKKED